MYLLVFYFIGVFTNFFLLLRGGFSWIRDGFKMEENNLKFSAIVVLEVVFSLGLSWILYFIYYIRKEGYYL